MYGYEDAYKRCFEKASTVGSALAAVSLITGFLFANSLCDMDLSEWHIVNAILCGSLAAAAHFAQHENSRAMQNAFRMCKFEMPFAELKSEGLKTAAASVALAACPALLLFWTARGFASMGVGICAESAPMFFGISLCVMLFQGAALACCIGHHLQNAGYSLETVKYHGQRLFFRVKELVMDLSYNGTTYLRRAYDNIMPKLWELFYKLKEMAHRLYEQRPKYMSASYWSSSEGSYLLR